MTKFLKQFTLEQPCSWWYDFQLFPVSAFLFSVMSFNFTTYKAYQLQDHSGSAGALESLAKAKKELDLWSKVFASFVLIVCFIFRWPIQLILTRIWRLSPTKHQVWHISHCSSVALRNFWISTTKRSLQSVWVAQTHCTCLFLKPLAFAGVYKWISGNGYQKENFLRHPVIE